MISLVGIYCAGRVSDPARVGQPKPKRGKVLQKFSATCAGGMTDRFGGKKADFEVELM